jgi:3-hydroxy-9,10-secoandrosta-1,3,5(10)-triene-9,17-dione monooxygenase reductase component
MSEIERNAVVDPAVLRKAMSHFATGVTVVATRHVGGGVCGLTANAFTSVSLVPPLVLVCVDRRSLTYPCLEANGFFAASFLSDGQHALSLRFAERRDDKFDGVPYRTGVTGAPILTDSIGHLECRTSTDFAGGDHAIILARVVAAEAGEGMPLVFFRGAYTTVGSPAEGEEPLPGEPEEAGPA